MRTLSLDEDLYRYLLNVSLREHPVLTQLRNATRANGDMQISPEQGQLMALLVKLMGARRILEIGVLTGYSALAVALALPADGRVVGCDVNEDNTEFARTYWKKAGVDHRIDLHLAPAIDTLDAIIADGQAGCFDFAFIDADKVSYDAYYERCVTLLRRGGLMAIDNTLWGGKVAHPAEDDDTAAIQALNRKLQDDQRVDLSLLPVGDGLTLARKR